MEVEIGAFGLLCLVVCIFATLIGTRRRDVLYGSYIEHRLGTRIAAIAAV